MSWCKQKLADVFGLDPRSLATFRIGIGIVLLVDLAIRARDLPAMYAGDGILSIERSVKWAGDWGWSLHWLSGDVWFQSLLFIIAAAFAVALVLGFHTRLAMIACWFMLVSLQTRNPLLLNGGDGMLRVLMFWGMFLPLGTVWSVDAQRRHRKGKQSSHTSRTSVAGACFILQLCLVYWFAGTIKLNAIWLGFDPNALGNDPSLLWRSAWGGEALMRAMSYDIYSKPLAEVLLQSPLLLRWICLGTLVLEIVGPLLLFVPFGTRHLRLLVIAGFALLHVGIELTLHVGLFSWVSLAGWAILLPAMFWESRPLSAVAHRLPRGIFGQWLINDWCYPLSRLSELLHSRMQSNAAKITALIGAHIVPALFCLLVMIAAITWNVSYRYDKETRKKIQQPFRPIANITLMRQRWNMFGRPTKNEKWFVYRAELTNGKSVDLLREDGILEMRMPYNLSSHFPNHRWRKLHVNLNSKTYRSYRHDVANVICRQWNESHAAAQQVQRLRVYQLTENDDASQNCKSTLCLTIDHRSEKPDGAAPNNDAAEEDFALARLQSLALSRR